MIRPGITDRDRYRWMAEVRFLPGLIIIVLSLNWGSAFGEEIPAGQPPVSENVEPPKGAISANEGFLDSSHGYLDRKINGLVRWFDGLFGDTDESDSAMAKNWLWRLFRDLHFRKGADRQRRKGAIIFSTNNQRFRDTPPWRHHPVFFRPHVISPRARGLFHGNPVRRVRASVNVRNASRRLSDSRTGVCPMV